MSKRSFHATNWTPTPTADAAALAAGTFMGMQGGSATNMVQIIEVLISGLAGASNPMIMQLARVSTLVSTGGSALVAPNGDGFMNPSALAQTSGASAFVAGTAAGPQRSNATTDTRLELNINDFGGIVRWQAAPGEEWWIVGNTTPGGSSVLSQFTGGSSVAVSSHIIYENL